MQGNVSVRGVRGKDWSVRDEGEGLDVSDAGEGLDVSDAGEGWSVSDVWGGEEYKGFFVVCSNFFEMRRGNRIG